MDVHEINQSEIEALIFVSENGLTLDELAKFYHNDADDGEYSYDMLNETLAAITNKYNDAGYGIELTYVAGRYQFLSKKIHHPQIQKMQAQRIQKNLSKAALETLAIIAYKQPCVKSEIESIRGVNCDYSIDKLLEKNLIAITGQSDAPGKPLIYATSSLFLNYLGLDTIEALPAVKELILPDTSLDG